MKPQLASISVISVAFSLSYLSSQALALDLHNQSLDNIYNRTPKEVWISADRGDGSGQGTQLDPFDGGTQSKLDAILADNSKTPIGTTIHFGPGTFETAPHDTGFTNLRSDWTLAGAGMYQTTVRIASATNLAGR